MVKIEVYRNRFIKMFIRHEKSDYQQDYQNNLVGSQNGSKVIQKRFGYGCRRWNRRHAIRP